MGYIGSKQTARVARSAISFANRRDRSPLLIRRIVFHQFRHRPVSRGTLLNDRLGLGFSGRQTDGSRDGIVSSVGPYNVRFIVVPTVTPEGAAILSLTRAVSQRLAYGCAGYTIPSDRYRCRPSSGLRLLLLHRRLIILPYTSEGRSVC
jgi:hypothetical protein